MALGGELARALAVLSESPDAGLQLHLRGELGVGKTTLVRGLLRALGVAGIVRSPTYTLLEAYTTASWQVVHFDLYRIADGDELELLGAREYFRAGVLSCVEWPQRAAGWLPAPDLVVELSHQGPGRNARISALSEPGLNWQKRLSSH